MIERYKVKEIDKIFSEEEKFKTWLKIEILVCEALSKLNIIPDKVVQNIKEKAKFTISEIKEEEKKTNHDVVAFLNVVGRYLKEDSKYLHLGLTSSDLLDTTLGYLLKKASKVILKDLKKLLFSLKKKAYDYKHTPIIGRTHGIHAEVTTLGLKFALWFSEFKRHQKRLLNALNNIAYGKISGAVGNYAHIPPDVERYVCKMLNLKPAPISSQIIQRDRHAEFLFSLALISTSAEKVATEIRHLQRTEISELEEPFLEKQTGSSAMPHKKNPIISERICGLSRILRANVLASLENIPLWHERDISHSSVERIIIPDSCHIVCYILRKLNWIIENLKINKDKMLENINLTKGLIFSQKILLKLMEKGLGREKAYRIIQRNAMKANSLKKDLKEILAQDEEILSILSLNEINSCFDISSYLKHVDYILNRVFYEEDKSRIS